MSGWSVNRSLRELFQEPVSSIIGALRPLVRNAWKKSALFQRHIRARRTDDIKAPLASLPATATALSSRRSELDFCLLTSAWGWE